MILPKGTVEFQMSGGDNAVEDIMNKIKSNSMTGYILVLGKIENQRGELEDVTGQLVFKEGGAVLCETVLRNKSHKGKEGIFPFLKALMIEDSSIEFKTKIDVEPPIAFFKECTVDDTHLDIGSFKEKVKQEEEERRKTEEERKRREGKKAEIRDRVDDWLSEGYLIPSFPSIMDRNFTELEEWYEDLTKRMIKVGDHLKWLSGIKEVEVVDQKAELTEMMKRPEEMQAIESALNKFKDSLEAVSEKRQEIHKWVHLWKEEGYNTINIEEKLEEVKAEVRGLLEALALERPNFRFSLRDVMEVLPTMTD
ncbi:MAG: hypothetical protein ACMUHY_05965, partial [Thermoplasmatota archaeon]